MIEQVTEAVVLDKEFTYDAHVRVHLFTKECGKIVAKATSARKITSKLGPHLEPLLVSTVRYVQQRGLPQLIDALRVSRLGYDPTFASCEWCGGEPADFSLKTLFFVCPACVPRCGSAYDCLPV